MSRIYLHIGAPKTATSSLQRLLADRPAAGSSDEFYYPLQCRNRHAHHPLACDLLQQFLRQENMLDHWYGDVPRGNAWSRLRDELTPLPDDARIVLSSELFFGQGREFLPAMQHMAGELAGHEISIVVYLRRQDQFFSSFFNQDIKGGRRWRHNAYRFYKSHRLFEESYHAKLGCWANVFGRENVLVRPFEREQWHHGSIAADFAATVGLTSLNGERSENSTSLGPVQLHIKRCLNKTGLSAEQNNEALQLLGEICPEEPCPDVRYVNARFYDRLREGWCEDNERIATDYLRGRPLFLQAIPESGDLPRFKVPKFNVAVYLELMLRYFGAGHSPHLRPLFARATLLAIADLNVWNIGRDGKAATLLEWAEDA